MDAVLSIVAIVLLGAASVLLVMALLRMFKGIAPARGQAKVRVRDHRQMGKLARSGSPVPESHAEPVREMVEQQLDMLERIEAARPLMLGGVALFAVGVTLFALGSDREVLPLLVLVAAMAVFWLLSTAFTTWVLRKYEATAAANAWITYSEEPEHDRLPHWRSRSAPGESASPAAQPKRASSRPPGAQLSSGRTRR